MKPWLAGHIVPKAFEAKHDIELALESTSTRYLEKTGRWGAGMLPEPLAASEQAFSRAAPMIVPLGGHL